MNERMFRRSWRREARGVLPRRSAVVVHRAASCAQRSIRPTVADLKKKKTPKLDRVLQKGGRRTADCHHSESSSVPLAATRRSLRTG